MTLRRQVVAALVLLLLFSIMTTGCSGETDERISPPSQQSPSEKARVIRVIDGDTIVVSINGVTEKVRLIGIDTPERGKPYYGEATNKTKELCNGKEVRLEKDVSERDRYQRLLRYVYVGDLFVNAELVRQGYAVVYTYPPDVGHNEYFLKLGQEARQNNVGLWASSPDGVSSPQPEAQIPSSSTTGYIGNKNSRKFHLPSCTGLPAPQNQVLFDSREAAIAAGYVPCKNCKP